MELREFVKTTKGQEMLLFVLQKLQHLFEIINKN